MEKRTRRDSGSVMVFIIALVLIAAVVLFAGTTLVVSSNRAIHKVTTIKQAHYIAEMGIEKIVSDPFVIRNALAYGEHEESSGSSIPLENNKSGTYRVKVTYNSNEKTIRIESTGEVKNNNSEKLAQKTITCTFRLSQGPFYDIVLQNAITTAANLTSGKVYIYLDEGVNQPANVYSGAEITNIRGEIPGSVFAQGSVVVDNKTVVMGDVIARGSITLNNSSKIEGKVISAESYVDVNNNVVVNGDIVAYGTDDKGYSVYLNNATVGAIYTSQGSSQVKTNNSSYTSINTISSSSYPPVYEVPQQNLPTITDEIRAMWMEKASEGETYDSGLTVNNGQTLTLDGNTLIEGDLVVKQNATLNIKEGAVIYVTGRILIENNASICVEDTNGDEKTLFSTLITEDYFDIANNAIPEALSLVALGPSTSYLKNNSVTTGPIFVPNGNLELSNNAVVYGGVFAKSIPKIGNNMEIYFNPFNNLSLPPTITDTKKLLELLEWSES
ncbi:MAG: hypothetical protein H5U36_08105 [Candidatus Caldatribacterium sp.]|nr:hypothetical protein [Candidatus Caldatribacterium sp.]